MFLERWWYGSMVEVGGGGGGGCGLTCSTSIRSSSATPRLPPGGGGGGGGGRLVLLLPEELMPELVSSLLSQLRIMTGDGGGRGRAADLQERGTNYSEGFRAERETSVDQC